MLNFTQISKLNNKPEIQLKISLIQVPCLKAQNFTDSYLEQVNKSISEQNKGGTGTTAKIN
jgi:hypothetical protein